ncbi:hypothetical protein ACS0TY_011898 [Phlomoides rotata]
MQSPCRASSTALVLLIFCLNCLVIQVSSLDTLKQAPDNLNSPSQLVSANKNFTLGFYTLKDSNNSYLAIWFEDPWFYSIVWIGNREKPIPSNVSAVLTIGSRGEMRITYDGGEAMEIYGGGSGVQSVTATLLDSGNFVLKSNESSAFLWQSFDHPTDTLLPGMKIGVNRRPGRNWTLSSWLRDDNPAPGAFTLEWDPNEGKFLVRRRGEVYWRSGELQYYNDEEGKSRVELENFSFVRDAFNFNFNFTNVTNDEEWYLIFSVIPVAYSTQIVLSGWKLNYEGDIYDISKSMTIVRPSLCYNYYNQRSYNFKGCASRSREQPTCRNEHQKFTWKSGYFRPDKGEEEQIFENKFKPCWNNCTCAAYTSGATGCSYWRGKNLEFVQSVDGSVARKYFLETESAGGNKKKRVLIILSVVGSVVLLILAITLFILQKLKQGKREEELHELLTLEGYTETYEMGNGGGNSHDLKLFTYASIVSATRNFSSNNKLGQGGFGPIYKGKTPEGQDIAVKVLSRQSGQGIVELKTELILISKLQHVNLVKLIGFCIHGDDKMIIYEYMHNKSLDFFIFDPCKREQLDWQKRFNIIEGTAQGLLYLHKYSRLKIIHRDLKPNNILLDEKMNPKISDFGLARIFKQDDSDAKTNICVGTRGYMAPEYVMQGIFSVKSDVYSFGVLVLEIVSGRKNNSFHDIEGPLSVVEYAWELWRKDSALELMDPTLSNSCVIEQVLRCIHIGLLCVENRAVDRPTIENVLSMLKNESKSLVMLKNPAFIIRNNVSKETEKLSANEITKLSADEVTISEMEGR